jgi:hypothetical protein
MNSDRAKESADRRKNMSDRKKSCRRYGKMDSDLTSSSSAPIVFQQIEETIGNIRAVSRLA